MTSDSEKTTGSRCEAENIAEANSPSTLGQHLTAEKASSPEQATAGPGATRTEESSSVDEDPWRHVPPRDNYENASEAASYHPDISAAQKIESYDIASAWLRLGAWLVDSVIASVITIAAGIIWALFSFWADVQQFEFAGLFAVLAYPVIMTWMVATRGQTPGKMVVGIKIVRTDGRRIGFGLAILREWIGKFISLAPFFIPFFHLGYLWIIWDSKRQAWHDKLADTLVVRIR